jgi:trans-AT polyketide synthase, acyltransferase and oxidoreductase domains
MLGSGRGVSGRTMKSLPFESDTGENRRPGDVSPMRPIGRWRQGEHPPFTDSAELRDALLRVHEPLYVIAQDDGYAFGRGGSGLLGSSWGDDAPLLGYVGPVELERLGDPAFCADHRIRYPYYAGAMANGIASVELVEAMAHSGLLGIFGAAGLAPRVVEQAIDRLSSSLGDLPFGVNLIHSPNEKRLEDEIVDILLEKKIGLVEASAYLDLTLPVVRYRVHGIHRDDDGRIVTPNRVIAKISRVEVASKFLAPPPAAMLRELVSQGHITEQQATLASQIPMAQDITAEAESAGHTDNRPAITLLPTIRALAERMQRQYGYRQKVRVGLAGGISTPESAAAAFAMGAAFIVTGSINQACVESGSSDEVRQMLAETQQADVAMAPAADMFEMGVTVQVLKRGTMFPMRAAKLYELYRGYDSLDAIPADERAKLEKTVFRAPLSEIWTQTRAFFAERDPKQIELAERDPKHRMALVFRWYLGQSSRWANRGESSRRVDYQIWCGPAMGAFNEWVRDSIYAPSERRRVGDLALNILFGAAVLMRVNQLRTCGAAIPAELQRIAPLDPSDIKEYLS